MVVLYRDKTPSISRNVNMAPHVLCLPSKCRKLRALAILTLVEARMTHSTMCTVIVTLMLLVGLQARGKASSNADKLDNSQEATLQSSNPFAILANNAAPHREHARRGASPPHRPPRPGSMATSDSIEAAHHSSSNRSNSSGSNQSRVAPIRPQVPIGTESGQRKETSTGHGRSLLRQTLHSAMASRGTTLIRSTRGGSSLLDATNKLSSLLSKDDTGPETPGKADSLPNLPMLVHDFGLRANVDATLLAKANPCIQDARLVKVGLIQISSYLRAKYLGPYLELAGLIQNTPWTFLLQQMDRDPDHFSSLAAVLGVDLLFIRKAIDFLLTRNQYVHLVRERSPSAAVIKAYLPSLRLPDSGARAELREALDYFDDARGHERAYSAHMSLRGKIKENLCPGFTLGKLGRRNTITDAQVNDIIAAVEMANFFDMHLVRPLRNRQLSPRALSEALPPNITRSLAMLKRHRDLVAHPTSRRSICVTIAEVFRGTEFWTGCLDQIFGAASDEPPVIEI